MESVETNSTSSSAEMANATATVMTGSASASASGSQVEVGAVVKTESSSAGDSCTWYADSDCLRPRSCSDCLNVLLSSDSVRLDAMDKLQFDRS